MDAETKAAFSKLDTELHVLKLQVERLGDVQRVHARQLLRIFAHLLPDQAASLQDEAREMLREAEERRVAQALAKYQKDKAD